MEFVHQKDSHKPSVQLIKYAWCIHSTHVFDFVCVSFQFVLFLRKPTNDRGETGTKN